MSVTITIGAKPWPFSSLRISFTAARLSAPALDQNVEDLAFVIHRAPKVHLLTVDPDDHLVEMPVRARTRSMMAQATREDRSELQNPAPNRLIRDLETALGEQLLSVAVAQGEAEIQPNGMLDDETGEPVAAVAERGHLATLPYPPTVSDRLP